VASTIRVHKLTVLAKDEVIRRLGELAPSDHAALAEVLRRFFAGSSGVVAALRLDLHPRPTKGIFVAITVMNWTFASSGRFAI
jgi:hypothetical protein